MSGAERLEVGFAFKGAGWVQGVVDSSCAWDSRLGLGLEIRD